MGVAIAEAAMRRGAKVTLIYGPGTVPPPAGVKVLRVESTEEMLEAAVKTLEGEKQDVAILSAAACDYGAPERNMIKTPSGMERWRLELRPLPKIIEHVKKIAPDTYLVGFKAEFGVPDDELVRRARARMDEVGMDLIVANDVAREDVGFGADTNEVFIIDAEGNTTHIPVTGKTEIAERLLSIVKDKMPGAGR